VKRGCGGRLERQAQLEGENNIINKWAREDVNTLYDLLNDDDDYDNNYNDDNNNNLLTVIQYSIFKNTFFAWS
jgi:exonuclease V gamma subunit